ncbi:hypothetical protein DICSQDRAFT_104771 [Dichomitus squalens LYAD-421 SS1]|uniref:RRM domain-containing protein n=1 Tax=Dichomitus squalens (strain LYAD-421) TaxID=732165 RepID=R7T1U2_DICSQ|nr:uncharacterized protein DICSQDRAFT_104771 [Dichomitus squalens LYAD-421 SS1]EJF62336.1 hypothetical protein DICSQDRAFT_104771 [Dichomitus squalens LYAD-421 SS1]
MNVVREINKINERELDLGISGSWHDDYKDSAYIFVGGLHRDLTEGDVITIFSQYGEIMDINLPRDKETGKQKGFAFLMYEDQRSTILAVDNLNGAQVLDRTLRVDHVKNYKQPKAKGEDGEWKEAEEQSLNAKPPIVIDGDEGSESSDDSGPEIDPEDPMAEYLIAKRKEEKLAKKGKKSKSKRKHRDETPEERRARKERKRLKKEKGKSAGMAAVEDLLKSLGGGTEPSDRRRSASPRRSRSRTPPAREYVRDRDRYSPGSRHNRSRERSPPRRRSPTPPYRSRHENDDDDRRRHRRDDATLHRTRRGYD